MLQYLGKAATRRRFVAMDLTDPALDFARIAEDDRSASGFVATSPASYT